jgi:hypothetical protein
MRALRDQVNQNLGTVTQQVAVARKAFIRDVKKRVDETAKYIRPDAGI